MSEQNSFFRTCQICWTMSSCKLLFLSLILYGAIHRFSPFVKVDAESYVLGHAVKKAPGIAEAEIYIL